MKAQFVRAGRVLILTCGLALCALGLAAMVASNELTVRLTAALVFAAGLVVILLSLLLLRFGVFVTVLRHVQYLTQSSEYMARLVREITEVMKAIEEAESEERRNPGRRKSGGSPYEDPLSEEERELESTVRQFEE